jgi:hypothetical protein
VVIFDDIGMVDRAARLRMIMESVPMLAADYGAFMICFGLRVDLCHPRLWLCPAVITTCSRLCDHDQCDHDVLPAS